MRRLCGLCLAVIGMLYGTHAQAAPKTFQVFQAESAAATAATPEAVTVEELPDTALPKDLEKAGDPSTAILEWKRLETSTFNHTMREASAISIARLYQQTGKHAEALTFLATFLQKNPQSPRTSEVLYLMSVNADALAAASTTPSLENALTAALQPVLSPVYAKGWLKQQSATTVEDGTVFRTKLNKTDKSTVWADEAAYAGAWVKAAAGQDISGETAGRRGPALMQRLAEIGTTPTQSARTAAWASVVPGVGHMLAGKPVQGVGFLLLAAVSLYAALSGWRRKDVPLTLFFIAMYAALVVTTASSAFDMAFAQAKAQRLSYMTRWQDVAPKYIIPTPKGLFNATTEGPALPDRWCDLPAVCK